MLDLLGTRCRLVYIARIARSTLREVRDPLGENRRKLVQINRVPCRRGSGRIAAWRNASLPEGAMPSNAKTSVAAVFRLQAGMDISRCKTPWSDLAGEQDGGYGAPNEGRGADGRGNEPRLY
jgi:hypothetical protein